jgi:hypothetical protein
VGNLRSSSMPPMSPGLSPVGMNLRSADFEWVTMELVKIADICCNGRLVSVLEGGYGSYPSIQPPSGGVGKGAGKGVASSSEVSAVHVCMQHVAWKLLSNINSVCLKCCPRSRRMDTWIGTFSHRLLARMSMVS